MNKTKVTIGSILMAGLVFLGGSFYYAETGELAPTEASNLEVSIDSSKSTPLEKSIYERRIQISAPLAFWGETAFTVNDIISEMNFEHEQNGESERYLLLKDLKEKTLAEVQKLH